MAWGQFLKRKIQSDYKACFSWRGELKLVRSVKLSLMKLKFTRLLFYLTHFSGVVLQRRCFSGKIPCLPDNCCTNFVHQHCNDFGIHLSKMCYLFVYNLLLLSYWNSPCFRHCRWERSRHHQLSENDTRSANSVDPLKAFQCAAVLWKIAITFVFKSSPPIWAPSVAPKPLPPVRTYGREVLFILNIMAIRDTAYYICTMLWHFEWKYHHMAML